MNIGRFLTALIAPVWLYAPAQSTFFEADFSSGKMPAGMEASNTGESLPEKDFYRHGFTADGWTVERVGAKGYAAVAPTRTIDSAELTAMLATPMFRVESEGAWLRWDARSMLPGFPEAYDVAVAADGSDNWDTVFSVEAENDVWQTRLLPLDEFAGREIRVAFISHGGSSYMLAVRDIFAGIPTAPEWSLSDTTPRFAAIGSDGTASGSLTNFGAPASDVTLICRSGEETEELHFPGIWPTGETRDFSFPIPLSLNESTRYSLTLLSADGQETELGDSEVFTSHFERTLLIDEGTGMWCNNCPDGILALDNLKREFGTQAAILSCHANDVLSCQDYWGNLGFYAVPYMKLNREKATAGSDASKFAPYYNTPTTAHIALKAERRNGSGTVSLLSTVRFAEQTDNNSGRYRIGYAVTADLFAPDSILWYQSNNISFPRGEQYYFLPTRIPSTLARFDNVVCEGATAFTGIEGSLPSEIPAMEPMTAVTQVELPEITGIAESVRIVAFIIDTETGLIENAACAELSGNAGIETAEIRHNDMTLRVSAYGKLDISGIAPEESVTVTAFSADGRTLWKKTDTSSSLNASVIPLPSGPVIVTATAGASSSRCKAIIRH